MDTAFFCSDCGSQHNDPADARLGHLVLCLACALHRDYNEAALVVSPIASALDLTSVLPPLAA